MPGRSASLILVCGFASVLSSAMAASGVSATSPVRVSAPMPGVWLVAQRELTGSIFERSVVYLLRHDEHGSLGVIVNRRTRFHLHDLLPELDREQAGRHVVHIGGPVAPQAMLMLMRNEKPASGIEPVMGEVAFSAERDVLDALIARRKSPTDLRLYIGHAGWAAGQLEAELARDSWFLVKADINVMFGDDVPELWERLINRLDPPGIRVRGPDPVPVSGKDRYTHLPQGLSGRALADAAH